MERSLFWNCNEEFVSAAAVRNIWNGVSRFAGTNPPAMPLMRAIHHPKPPGSLACLPGVSGWGNALPQQTFVA